jgi:hypothetical protein
MDHIHQQQEICRHYLAVEHCRTKILLPAFDSKLSMSVEII